MATTVTTVLLIVMEVTVAAVVVVAIVGTEVKWLDRGIIIKRRCNTLPPRSMPIQSIFAIAAAITRVICSSADIGVKRQRGRYYEKGNQSKQI